MTPWLSGYALALGALALLWLGVASYVLVTRALYDFRDLSFHGAKRVLDRRRRSHGDDDVEALLRGFPRRTLAGIAADASTPRGIAVAAARKLLARSRGRVVRRATRHRGEGQKWRRVAALRILSLAEPEQSLPILERALGERDEDLRGAVVGILGSREDVDAAHVLVDALRTAAYSRSRIATPLDEYAIPIADLILPLVDALDPEVRTWGAALLARYPERRDVADALATLAGDPDPAVRSAAMKSMCAVGGAKAVGMAVTLLADPVWFVRAHAARALGRLERADLSPLALPLLADESWWVRSAVKDAFQRLGDDAAPLLVPALRSGDEFARNGAAEILDELGVVDRLVAAATADPQDRDAAEAVRLVFRAGGHRLVEAAARRSDPDERARIAELAEIPTARTA